MTVSATVSDPAPEWVSLNVAAVPVVRLPPSQACPLIVPALSVDVQVDVQVAFEPPVLKLATGGAVPARSAPGPRTARR